MRPTLMLMHTYVNVQYRPCTYRLTHIVPRVSREDQPTSLPTYLIHTPELENATGHRTFSDHIQ